MTSVIFLSGAALFFFAAVHAISLASTFRRWRSDARLPLPERPLPPISLLIPVSGMESHLTETLGSAFALEAGTYEILFCLAREDDPAIKLIERLIAENRQIPSRLLIGDDRPSINPKLNNLVKGWACARHDWIVMADSNVLLPGNALARMMTLWDEGTGLVCSPPLGVLPEGIWAAVEAGFLNTFQLRWQMFADQARLGFAQGKAMLWRRADLEAAGGILALASEPGEDAAATKLLRTRGLKVRLVRRAFPQPLGMRSLAAVWQRQLRWARLRRASFPLLYASELAAGGALPFVSLLALILSADLSPAWIGAYAALWYGGEALLARGAGWPLSSYSPLAFIARDLMLPVLWLGGWGRRFVWRGNGMDIARASQPAAPPAIPSKQGAADRAA